MHTGIDFSPPAHPTPHLLSMNPFLHPTKPFLSSLFWIKWRVWNFLRFPERKYFYAFCLCFSFCLVSDLALHARCFVLFFCQEITIYHTFAVIKMEARSDWIVEDLENKRSAFLILNIPHGTLGKMAAMSSVLLNPLPLSRFH